MPFEFQPLRDNYSGTIAELMGRPAQAAADAVKAQAQAQAQAAQAKGAAWSGALGNIGQIIGALPQEIRAQQTSAAQRNLITAQTADAQAQVQERTAAAAAASRKNTQDQAIAGAMQGAGAVGEDGIWRVDRNTFEKSVVDAGLGNRLPEFSEQLDRMDQAALKTKQAHNNAIAEAGYSLALGDHSPTAIALTTAHLVKNKLVSQDEVQPFLDSMAQNPASAEQISQQMMQLDPNVADRFLKRQTELANQGKTRAEADKDEADAALSRAKAAPPDPTKLQAQIDAIAPAGQAPWADLRTRTIARVQNARTFDDAQKAIEDAAEERRSVDVAKNTVPYKIDVQTGGAAAAPGPGGEPTATAKAMAEYRLPPLSARSIQTPAGQLLMKQVIQANPAYDATQYEQRQKTRIAYTTGTEGQQLNAMNTAILHMDVLADAAAALKNGDFKPGNAIYNSVKDLFGGAAPNSYSTIKEFLDGEVGAVVKKGVATEGEMGRLEGKGGSSSSPEQLQTYIQNAVRILGGKAAVLDDKYHSVMGTQDPFTAVSPRAGDVLIKHGFNPADMSSGKPATAASNGDRVRVKGPNGQAGTVPKGTALPAGWSLQ